MVKHFTNLIIDLDGTLIGRDEKISSKVFNAIEKLKHFININIASGRESAGVLKYAKELKIEGPQISDNGAIIIDVLTGNYIWGDFIGHDISTSISEDIRGLDLPVLATHISGTSRNLNSIPQNGFNRISIMDLYVDQAENVINLLNKKYDLEICKVYLPYNDRWAVDLTNKGINKGRAAIELSKILDVNISNMIAVGDSYNDISVFKVCGLSVAMGHAPKELKNIADFVAPSVDFDGLAIAIDEFILPKLH